MILFFQRSETIPMLSLPINGYQNLKLKNIHKEDSPSYENIYVLSTPEFNNHFEFIKNNNIDVQLFQVPEKTIKESLLFPPMLGNTKSSELFRSDLDTLEVVEVLSKEKKRKLSIVIYSENRFALGDSLVQASVFKNLHDQIVAKGIECEFVTYRSLSTMPRIDNYLSIFPELKIRYLPTNLNNLRYADLILTDSDYANIFDMDMHDAFASQLCFKLSEDFTVANTLSYDIHTKTKAESLYKEVFNNKNPILAFNKESSALLRTMPNNIAEKIITELLETNKFNIVSFDRDNLLDINHKNYKVMSNFTQETMDFISFLAATDGLISVDSGPVHIAARLGIPSYTFYTSIDPIIREKYYSNSTSVFLENEYKNMHFNKDLTPKLQGKIWENLDMKKTIKEIVKKFKKGIF